MQSLKWPFFILNILFKYELHIIQIYFDRKGFLIFLNTTPNKQAPNPWRGSSQMSYTNLK